MARAKRSTEVSFIRRMLDGKRIPSSWSVSAYEAYSECPAQYALSRIINYCLKCGSHEGKSAWGCTTCGTFQPWAKTCRVKKCGGAVKKHADKHCVSCNAGPDSAPAIDRGIVIHAQAEQYLRGKIKLLPDDLETFRSEFANLRKRGAQPEVSWTLTKDGRTCEPTDWDRAWVRVKIDAHDYDRKARHLTIIDYKTGKEKPQEFQAEVYCWVSPYYYPDLKTVSAEFWWTNTGNVTHVPADKKGSPKVWTRKDLVGLESTWRQRATTMLSDTKFAATPGTHCGRCRYRSSNFINGRPGPCDAWKATV